MDQPDAKSLAEQLLVMDSQNMARKLNELRNHDSSLYLRVLGSLAELQRYRWTPQLRPSPGPVKSRKV